MYQRADDHHCGQSAMQIVLQQEQGKFALYIALQSDDNYSSI